MMKQKEKEAWMTPIKRLTAIAAVMAALCMTVPLFAQEVPAQQQTVGMRQESENVRMMAKDQDDPEDPLYKKYHSNMRLMSGGPKLTISTADEGLTHQSVFDERYERSYGIDVSKWNEDIDWNKVRDDGVEFVIIRLGYRGSAQGTLTLDPYFEEFIEGAHKAGIKIGVYFFTQAVNEAEAKEEAEFCVEHLKPYKSYVTYPIIIDIEPLAGGRFEKADLTKKEMTAICDTFCSTAQSAGYKSGIYCSKYYYSAWLDMSGMEDDYYVWVAQYATSTDYAGRFDMWQFSSQCSVSGVTSQYVDMNVAYELKQPSAPGNLQQPSIADDSITLSWSSVKLADGYRVYQYDKSGELLDSFTTDKTGYQVQELKNNKAYQFRVRAYYLGMDGSKKWSGYSDYLTAYTTPSQVDGVSIDERTQEDVTVSWDEQSNVTGYRVTYWEDGDPDSAEKVSVTDSEVYLDGLSPRSRYWMKVQAYVKINDETKKYGTASLDIPVDTEPRAVTSLTATKMTDQSVTLSWKKLGDDVEYHVRWFDPDSGEKLGSQVASSNSCTVSGLSQATSYKFNVRARYKNAEGEQIYGTAASIAAKTRPDEIEDFIVYDETASEIVLKWSKKKGADGYRVYQYDSSEKEYVKVADTTNLTYTVKGLASAKALKYLVRAYIIVDGQKYLAAAGSPVTGVTAPLNVSKLKQNKNTKTSVTVSWSKTTRASGYQIRVYDRKGKKTAAYTTTKTSYTIKKLSGQYTIKVRAYKKSGDVTSYSLKNAKLSIKTK